MNAEMESPKPLVGDFSMQILGQISVQINIGGLFWTVDVHFGQLRN